MANDKDITLRKKDISQNWESLIRSFFGLTPFAGTALNELFFGNRSRKQQARVNEWVKSLASAIERISEEKLDKDYLRSEEFEDVFFSTLRRVANHGTKEKLQYFKNLLLNQVRLKAEPSFIETFLMLISQLSSKQLLLLYQYKINDGNIDFGQKKIREKQGGMMIIEYKESSDWMSIMEKGSVDQRRKGYDQLLSEVHENSNITEKEVYLFSIDLVSKYLLAEVTDLTHYKENKYFKITPYGDKFLAFVMNEEE